MCVHVQKKLVMYVDIINNSDFNNYYPRKAGLKRRTVCYLHVIRFLNSFIWGLNSCQFSVIILIRIGHTDIDFYYEWFMYNQTQSLLIIQGVQK